jgi:AraC family transcriptional regulator
MRPSTVESYYERILRALVHIQGHLDESLDLNELARVACFSPYHFHRIFRGVVGETVADHVRRLRLERAAQRLKSGERPVTDIAFEAGYEAHEAFTRAFRARFGASPSGFRESRPELAPLEPISVKVEKLAAMRVAFVRHVGPFKDVGAAWGSVMGWAGMRGLFGPHTRAIGVIHDDPDITAPDQLRYDASVTVLGDVRAEGSIGIQEIAGEDYAIARHRGPYDRISETYARMCGEWLPSSGRELATAPALEFYLNAPQTTRPEDLLTDACLPLEG